MIHPTKIVRQNSTTRRQGFLFHDQQQSLKKIQEVKGFNSLKTQIETLVLALNHVCISKKQSYFKDLCHNSELVDLPKQQLQQDELFVSNENQYGIHNSKQTSQQRNSSQRTIENYSHEYFQKNQQQSELDSDYNFDTSRKNQNSRNINIKDEGNIMRNIKKCQQLSKEKQILQYAAIVQMSSQLHRYYLQSSFLFLFRMYMKINKKETKNKKQIKKNVNIKNSTQFNKASTPSQFKKQSYSLFLKPCHLRQKQSIDSNKSIEYNKHLQEIEKKNKMKSSIEIRQAKIQRKLEQMLNIFNKVYASHYRTMKISSFALKTTDQFLQPQSVQELQVIKNHSICEFKTSQYINKVQEENSNLRNITESTSCPSPITIKQFKPSSIENQLKTTAHKQLDKLQQQNKSIIQNSKLLQIIIISQFLAMFILFLILRNQ